MDTRRFSWVPAVFFSSGAVTIHVSVLVQNLSVHAKQFDVISVSCREVYYVTQSKPKS